MGNIVIGNHATWRSMIFMKVGDHAGEKWEQILARKRRELETAGKIFWGYGGSACHPLTQVQPFARLSIEAGDVPVLVMQSVRSTMDEERYVAEEYSEDGVTWRRIPDGVRVTGSRYAIILGEVTAGDFLFDPREFEVGIGPSRGKRANEYLVGRTDKGCLVRSDRPSLPVQDSSELTKISHFGEMAAPYAVLLR